jgi:hypothetical protein
MALFGASMTPVAVSAPSDSHHLITDHEGVNALAFCVVSYAKVMEQARHAGANTAAYELSVRGLGLTIDLDSLVSTHGHRRSEVDDVLAEVEAEYALTGPAEWLDRIARSDCKERSERYSMWQTLI